jgi:hypothetical protein
LERGHDVAQCIDGNTTYDENCIRKGPTTFAGVEFRELREHCLDVLAASQAGEDVPETVDSGVIHEIAADGAEIVVAVKERVDGNHLGLRLSSERCEKGSLLLLVHL